MLEKAVCKYKPFARETGDKEKYKDEEYAFEWCLIRENHQEPSSGVNPYFDKTSEKFIYLGDVESEIIYTTFGRVSAGFDTVNNTRGNPSSNNFPFNSFIQAFSSINTRSSDKSSVISWNVGRMPYDNERFKVSLTNASRTRYSAVTEPCDITFTPITSEQKVDELCAYVSKGLIPDLSKTYSSFTEDKTHKKVLQTGICRYGEKQYFPAILWTVHSDNSVEFAVRPDANTEARYTKAEKSNLKDSQLVSMVFKAALPDYTSTEVIPHTWTLTIKGKDGVLSRSKNLIKTKVNVVCEIDDLSKRVGEGKSDDGKVD